MLGLHGHVHEGRGRYKMGRTVGFNPGSDYTEGMLRGVLIKLSDHKGVREYSFTMG
jgi:Icc-related predicted phosphoesterase